MIQKIFIDNYRCFSNFELQLDEFTLLLGSNGSGKSSVLDVIFAIKRLLNGTAKISDPGIFPLNSLTRWQNRNIQIFEIYLDISDESYKYRLEVEHNVDNKQARVKNESLFSQEHPLFTFIGGDVQWYRDNKSQGPAFSADWSESALARVPPRKDNLRLTKFLDSMRNVVVCGLYPLGFSSESKSEDSMLDRDGNNFVSWYRHIVQERQDLIPGFFDKLKDTLFAFKSIRLEKIGIDTRTFNVSFENEIAKFELNFNELSDGQRALIALYSLILLTENQDYTIFFDEPDNYIALREIQPWLISLNDACGSTLQQAVVCSHHPELIDYMGIDNTVLLKVETSGIVRANRAKSIPIDGGLKFSEIVARGWEG